MRTAQLVLGRRFHGLSTVSRFPFATLTWRFLSGHIVHAFFEARPRLALLLMLFLLERWVLCIALFRVFLISLRLLFFLVCGSIAFGDLISQGFELSCISEFQPLRYTSLSLMFEPLYPLFLFLPSTLSALFVGLHLSLDSGFEGLRGIFSWRSHCSQPQASSKNETPRAANRYDWKPEAGTGLT